MNISIETNKWGWGCDERGEFDLKYKNSPINVSVTSIDETGVGACVISRTRELARREVLRSRGMDPLDTPLECVAQSSYSLTGVGILSYKWSVSGASFVQGTDVTASTVVVETTSSTSTRFTVLCSVNGGKILVNESFKHQRYLTDALTPSTILKPAEDLVPIPVNNGLTPVR